MSGIVLVAGLFFASSAQAVTLTIDTEPIIQQSEQGPCVIGDPSCKNPDVFDFTLIPANTDSGTLDSPTYTVQDIRDVVGDLFFVGIDVNQAQDVYNLESFSISVGGVTQFTFGPELLSVANNGIGFSDYVLLGADLSGFAANAEVVFTVQFSGADAGREAFFLQEIPEPASLLLLSLAGPLVAMRRKFA